MRIGTSAICVAKYQGDYEVSTFSCSQAGRGRPAKAGGRFDAGHPAPRHNLAVVHQGDRHRARHCGSHVVTRLECGVAWHFVKTDGKPLAATEREALVPLIQRPHGRELLFDFSQAAKLFSEARAGGLARGGPDTRRPRGACGRQPRLGIGAVAGRDRLPAGKLHAPQTQSHRCRAHDVRPGELRALPPQGVQRRLGHQRPTPAVLAVRHDPRDAREEPQGHARRLQ